MYRWLRFSTALVALWLRQVTRVARRLRSLSEDATSLAEPLGLRLQAAAAAWNALY